MNKFDIDRKLGPMRIRAWMLVVNFVFNGIALYGLSRVFVTGAGWPVLIVGLVGTCAAIAVLTTPAKPE